MDQCLHYKCKICGRMCFWPPPNVVWVIRSQINLDPYVISNGSFCLVNLAGIIYVKLNRLCNAGSRHVLEKSCYSYRLVFMPNKTLLRSACNLCRQTSKEAFAQFHGITQNHSQKSTKYSIQIQSNSSVRVMHKLCTNLCEYTLISIHLFDLLS